MFRLIFMLLDNRFGKTLEENGFQPYQKLHISWEGAVTSIPLPRKESSLNCYVPIFKDYLHRFRVKKVSMHIVNFSLLHQRFITYKFVYVFFFDFVL